MTLFILFQLAVDGAALYLVYRWWTTRQPAVSTDTITAALQTVEAKVQHWELAFKKQQDAAEERLKTLHGICEQASRILHQSKTPTPQWTSREENEIKEALTFQMEKIPSIQQIEQTKQRLKADIPIDLRTLLRDQLA